MNIMPVKASTPSTTTKRSPSPLPKSAIEADLKDILQRQQLDCASRPIPARTEVENETYPPYGTVQYRTNYVKPDRSKPNCLNQEMAEEAVEKFAKKQSQIQKAIAAMDEESSLKKMSKAKSLDENRGDDPTLTEDSTGYSSVDGSGTTGMLEQTTTNATARAVWLQTRKNLRPSVEHDEFEVVMMHEEEDVTASGGKTKGGGHNVVMSNVDWLEARKNLRPLRSGWE